MLTRLLAPFQASSHALHKMRAVAAYGVAWSVCVCVCESVSLSVCLLVTFVSPAKRLNRWRCRLGLTRVDQGTIYPHPST